MNGPAFLADVEQVLAPALARGDVVVMDNLPAHKLAGVRDAVEKTGAEPRYLPPYSPINPIEIAFSKRKSLLKKGAAGTKYELWRAIASPPASMPSHLLNVKTTSPLPDLTSTEGRILRCLVPAFGGAG